MIDMEDRLRKLTWLFIIISCKVDSAVRRCCQIAHTPNTAPFRSKKLLTHDVVCIQEQCDRVIAPWYRLRGMMYHPMEK